MDIFCGCTARFVSDLVGNPENHFFHSQTRIEVANNNGADQIMCVQADLHLFFLAYDYRVDIASLKYELHHEKTCFLHMQNTKVQISCTVTVQLISAFVCTT